MKIHTKSMVLAYRLDASSHHVSHHSHSCGNVLMATWWIILFGRSWKDYRLFYEYKKKIPTILIKSC